MSYLFRWVKPTPSPYEKTSGAVYASKNRIDDRRRWGGGVRTDAKTARKVSGTNGDGRTRRIDVVRIEIDKTLSRQKTCDSATVVRGLCDIFSVPSTTTKWRVLTGGWGAFCCDSELDLRRGVGERNKTTLFWASPVVRNTPYGVR